MLLLGAAVAGVAVAVLAGDDDDDAPEVATTSSTTTTEGLTDAAQELLDRLERGRESPMHVRLESDEPSPQSPALTVSIWRDGDRVRQDLLLVAPGARTELSAFQLDDGNVICQRPAAEEWICQRALSLATEEEEPVGLVEAAAANLDGAEVTATDEEIDGTPVRCYQIERDEGPSTMCVTDDGVPMRLAVQGQQVTATLVEREVDDAVFVPPAEVTEPEVTDTSGA